MNFYCKDCGKSSPVFNNNPLGFHLCCDCINKKLDYNNLSHADFFCRTFNYPFFPEKWLSFVETAKDQVWKAYTDSYLSGDKNNLFYSTTTSDVWKIANTEWEKIKEYDDIIAAIEPIKEGFVKIAKAKWGKDYDFDQLIQLENLYTNTINANHITSPMQLDSIKKACKIGAQLDIAIEAQNGAAIKELSGSYATFVKTAKIEDVIEAANDKTIRTVADLADYLEQKGFELPYYDGVSRDIVDKTIEDMKAYLRTLVVESTGLDTLLENTQKAYEETVEGKAQEAAINAKPLEDFFIEQTEENEKEDMELATEEIYDSDDDDNEE